MRCTRWAAVFAVAVATFSSAPIALAHSASDAFLTLEAKPRTENAEAVVTVQWDIALRDLDFVLGLDANGDGNITWGELRGQQAAIERYAHGFLQASADGKACTVRPVRQMVANHADGAYAALTFDFVCAGAPSRLTLDYGMFFAVDPSHRCILVFRGRGGTSTALLSPQKARIDLAL